MSINWDELEGLAVDEGKDLLILLKPYTLSLARVGKDVVAMFVGYFASGELDEADALMYPHMKQEERDKLEKLVLTDAYNAALESYEDIQLMKEVGTKLAIALILKVVAL